MLHFFWCSYNLRPESYTIYESANLEIAKWAEFYLGQKIGFHQSNWLSGKVSDNPDDILIGHLTWDSQNSFISSEQKTQRNWVKNNSLTEVDSCHPNTYILTPWVPEFPVEWTNSMPFYESQLLTARKIFALCGNIWIDKTPDDNKSIQSQVKNKLIRCNMGVASQNLPIKKTKFNKQGEREIFHMSHLAAYKGFDITCSSLLGADTLLNVASGSINQPIGLINCKINGEEFIFNYIGSVNNNDQEFNEWLVDRCDFYIHTGKMDAQATTVLEMGARGLIPLVTPESGFECPDAIYLTFDVTENRKIIEWALNLPEEELLNRSHLIRKYIEKEHNWEGIFNRIWYNLIEDINNSKDKI